MEEEEQEDWLSSKNNTRSGPNYNLNIRNRNKILSLVLVTEDAGSDR
jgi:hypothetical protein